MSFHKHTKKWIFLPQEAEIMTRADSFLFILTIALVLRSPASDGREEFHNKEVSALKELIIKMADCLGEVNELHGGKQLHSRLDMGSLKTGDGKRRNVSNKKSHALVLGLWLQLSRALDHTWSKLLSTFGSDAASHDRLFIPLPHAEFWLFPSTYSSLPLKFHICTARYLILPNELFVVSSDYWTEGFQMPTHDIPLQYPFTCRAVKWSETFLCLPINNYPSKNVIGEPGVPLIHGFF